MLRLMRLLCQKCLPENQSPGCIRFLRRSPVLVRPVLRKRALRPRRAIRFRTSVSAVPVYEAEKSLFGISVNGDTLIPCEYFAIHHWPVADFFAGVFYLCWVPVPIAFGLWLYLKGDRQMYLRFAMVFLLVNLVGFAGYYIHPAAPPWYAMNYGFEAMLDTPGNVAGLGRFDELLGCTIFDSIYGRNANVFAAVPSLHAAYMVVALAYAIMNRCKGWLIALFAFIMVGIWCTAVYSGHHYLIAIRN